MKRDGKAYCIERGGKDHKVHLISKPPLMSPYSSNISHIFQPEAHAVDDIAQYHSLVDHIARRSISPLANSTRLKSSPIIFG